MTPLTATNLNGSTNPRSKRTISSKFTSFLSSKSSHINAFSVELDEPLRQHGPGDTVKGTIVVNVGRPLGITHVVASLYGYVQVFKNHSKATPPVRGNSARAAAGQNKRWVSEYHGDGFASLFEEEVVLCGEGRLDPKLYHFRFEIDFPNDLALPSSIDFERGTITYMVSATVTRPSTIGTTTSCERKVLFRENIDIGSLPIPKAREVTLRALDHSSRPKPNLKRLTSYERKRTSQSSTISRTNQSGRTLDELSSHFAPSNASSRSSSSSLGRVASLASELRSSQHSRSSKRSISNNHDKRKSIFVTVEASRSGCLPGELLPILIQVQHSKVIQSPHGIIVTLHRQARVDMHPNLPISSSVRSRDGRFEDYYPRSKTGLGGLSLSAAGSSQVWRKDLAQTFAPFYVDPRTMSTEVKVAIRIPDDVFPTMRSVPGEMISFRYFVEIIIDIHGKLGIAELTSGTSNSQTGIPSTPKGQSSDQLDYNWTLLEANHVDTSAIRRERNALVVECDLTIGTKDSQKARGKQRASSGDGGWTVDDGYEAHVEQLPNEYGPHHTMGGAQNHDNAEWYGYENDGYYYNADETGNNYDYSYDEYYNGYDYVNHQHSYPGQAGQHSWSNGQHTEDSSGHTPRPYHAVAPPPAEDESAFPEKERLRRHEARLLPSQPPIDVRSVAMNEGDAPTAPVLSEEECYGLSGPPGARSVHDRSPNRLRRSLESEVTNNPSETVGVVDQNGKSSMSVPLHGRDEGPSLTQPMDKQADERQELQARASPPGTAEGTREQEASAPTANEAEEAAALAFDNEQRRHLERLTLTGEPLPRYER